MWFWRKKPGPAAALALRFAAGRARLEEAIAMERPPPPRPSGHPPTAAAPAKSADKAHAEAVRKAVQVLNEGIAAAEDAGLRVEVTIGRSAKRIAGTHHPPAVIARAYRPL